MNARIAAFATGMLIILAMSGCDMMKQSAKHSFNDGIYQTSRFSDNKVYVLEIDDDTLSVIPVLEFKDSTSILTKKRVNYVANQSKFKDNKVNHSFFRPSLDVDLMTIPIKYRFPAYELPNTLTAGFSGAVYAGYRIDEYKLNYRRTPLNTYKQNIKHAGYSAGLYAGVGSTLINNSMLMDHNYPYEYEGLLLITGVAVNAALDKFTLGIAFGIDHLLDDNRREWIYEGQPYIGFTVGLNLN